MAIYTGDGNDNFVDYFDIFETHEIYGYEGDDTLYGGYLYDHIDGGDGDDYLFGYDGSDTLVTGAGADTATGGAGDDTIYLSASATLYVNWAYGNQGDDAFLPGQENDHIDGGQGEDYLYFYFSSAGVSANLQNGIGARGDAAGDTYRSIENIFGSDFNDILIGNGAYNDIDGSYGNDVVRGGAGGDYLDGGNDLDAVDYRDSDAAVSVDLGSRKASGGDAQGDQILNFEHVYGSAFNDRLLGDGQNNLLLANPGDDVAAGGPGNDNLQGQDGRDNLFGGADDDGVYGGPGVDLLNGGAGIDRLFGGTSADRFSFLATGDSRPGAWDTIGDFSRAEKDRIDLSGIDANTAAAGNQAFVFRGTGAFTGVNGQLQYAAGGGNLTVRGDVNGDKVADFAFIVSDEASLLATDLIL
jgi:Ca2+-binding RTX toxin-like protein